MSAGKKILEKDVEGYLCDECRKLGWNPKKNISDPIRGGTPGFPDQTIVLPYPNTLYVECKAPKTIGPYLKRRARWFETGDTTGCSKTDIRQYREQQLLEDLGHDVFIVGTYEQVDEFIAIARALYE